MAQDIQVITTCDPCDLHDIRGVTAVASHVLAIDGGPLKQIDVCARDEALFQEFLRIYTVSGREMETAAASAPARKRKAKAVETSQQKELEEAPVSQPDTKPAAKKPAKEKLFVLCPLPHPSTGGGPMRVEYSNRGTHAPMVHDGAHVWDIEWQDPDGILKAFCTEHAACNGIGFTSKAGLSQHIVYMRNRLPAVQDDGESDGQAEGP